MHVLQGIILDFDGVIANTEPLHLRAFQETLTEAGIVLSSEDYYSRYLGFDDATLFQELVSDREISMPEDHLSALIKRKMLKLQLLLKNESVLFPGAAEFIQHCSSEVPVAIASGAERHEILEVLAAGGGLQDKFSAIVATGDTAEGKPFPAPYQLAFTQLRDRTQGNIEARYCVAIEDSHWGLASARAAGLRCVGVTNTYPANELPGADLVVSGLDKLTLEILETLFAN